MTIKKILNDRLKKILIEKNLSDKATIMYDYIIPNEHIEIFEKGLSKKKNSGNISLYDISEYLMYEYYELEGSIQDVFKEKRESLLSAMKNLYLYNKDNYKGLFKELLRNPEISEKDIVEFVNKTIIFKIELLKDGEYSKYLDMKVQNSEKKYNDYLYHNFLNEAHIFKAILIEEKILEKFNNNLDLSKSLITEAYKHIFDIAMKINTVVQVTDEQRKKAVELFLEYEVKNQNSVQDEYFYCHLLNDEVYQFDIDNIYEKIMDKLIIKNYTIEENQEKEEILLFISENVDVFEKNKYIKVLDEITISNERVNHFDIYKQNLSCDRRIKFSFENKESYEKYKNTILDFIRVIDKSLKSINAKPLSLNQIKELLRESNLNSQIKNHKKNDKGRLKI